MPALLEYELTKWINQHDLAWAAFTLKSPRISNKYQWEPLLKIFFTELERKYVKSTVRKHRKKSGLPLLHRAVWIGGDKESCTALHSQGLVEIQDGGIDKLTMEMNKSWQHTVKNYFEKLHPVFIPEYIWLPEAKVWTKKFENGNAYSYYLNRNEGNDLGFGVQKVVMSATSLKPYATCFVKPC